MLVTEYKTEQLDLSQVQDEYTKFHRRYFIHQHSQSTSLQLHTVKHKRFGKIHTIHLAILSEMLYHFYHTVLSRIPFLLVTIEHVKPSSLHCTCKLIPQTKYVLLTKLMADKLLLQGKGTEMRTLRIFLTKTYLTFPGRLSAG